MAIYIFFYILIFLYCISPCSFKMRKGLLIILGIFLCTGYMTGSDWRAYELFYTYSEDIDWVSTYDKEKGLMYLFYCLNKLKIGFWPFWIVVKILCFMVFVYALKKYSNDYRWGLLFFFSYFALFYYIDNPMRNLISASFFIVSIGSIIEKQYVRAIFLIMCSIFFHHSVIIALFFFLILDKKIDKRLYYYVPIGFYLILVVVFYSGGINVINDYLILLFGNEYRGFRYIMEADIRMLSPILVFMFYLYYSSINILIKLNYNYKELILNGMLFYFMFFVLSYFIPILFRFSMFFSLFFISGLSIAVFYNIKKKQMLFPCIYVLFSTLMLILNITHDYRYIPYSSYIEYIFEEKPSYDKRTNYNFINSPYN